MPIAPLWAGWAGRRRNLPGPLQAGAPAELSATDQDVWPTRVLVVATNLGIGATVTISRVVGSTRTVVRGADAVTTTDASLLVVDAELPFGVPVGYVLAVDDVDVAAVASATRTLVGGKVAVTDAINAAASEVVITAWPSRDHERTCTRMVAGGRVVTVSGPLVDAETSLEILTETDLARESLVAMAAAAPGGVVQIRQPGGYGDVDCYLAVSKLRVVRWSQDGSDQRRRITLDGHVVDAWPATETAPGWTLADVADAYTGQTLADLAADFTTLLDVARHDWGL